MRLQGDQKLVLHKQNAITVDAGKMLDDVKKVRAGKMMKYVCDGRCSSPDSHRMSSRNRPN